MVLISLSASLQETREQPRCDMMRLSVHQFLNKKTINRIFLNPMDRIPSHLIGDHLISFVQLNMLPVASENHESNLIN